MLSMCKIKDCPHKVHFGVRLPRHNEVRHARKVWGRQDWLVEVGMHAVVSSQEELRC